MKKFLQKTSCFLMMLVLAISVIPLYSLNVKAQNRNNLVVMYQGYYVVDNLYYSLNKKKKTAVLAGGDETKVHQLVIPKTITIDGKTYTVTEIGDNAFFGWFWLTGELKIPNTVTKIGKCAFENDFYLTGKLKLPNSIKTIGDEAFENCHGFTGDLVIPNSVKVIKKHVFYGCYGFNGKIKLGNKVTKIGKNAFLDCGGLKGDLKIPSTCKSIGEDAFRGCYGLTGKLTIPKSVKKVGNYAFYDCYFKKIYNKSKCPLDLSSELGCFYYVNKNGLSCADNRGACAKQTLTLHVDKKAKNTITIPPRYDNDPNSKLNKEAVIFKGTNGYNPGGYTPLARSGGQQITVKKLSGNKKIKVDKHGIIKVGNLKKGIYKVKIKIKSISNPGYKSCSKTITIKVIVDADDWNPKTGKWNK